MNRDDALISLAAAILSNPGLNPLTVNPGDVVFKARLIADRLLAPATKPEPPAEPETVEPETPRAPHDGRWLARAIADRGPAADVWFRVYGRERGYPGKIEEWSRGMVALAVEAKITQQTTGAKS